MTVQINARRVAEVVKLWLVANEQRTKPSRARRHWTVRQARTGLLSFIFCWLCAVPLSAVDIVVGMSAAFTGPSRGLSIELYRGSLAYFKHVNDAGGIHGRRIVIRAYDDGYDPIPAIKNTIQLIEKDNVFLLFDYMGTPTTTRVLPLLKKYHDSQREVYLFCPFTGGQPLRQNPYNEFVFNLRTSYRNETATLVDHFVRIGRRRIAVFYQVDAYGRSGWDGVQSTLAEYDVQGRTIVEQPGGKPAERLRIVSEATYRRGTNFSASFRDQVDILKASKPDAVISVGTYSAAAGFIRDARDAGWDVPIANISGVDSENLLQLLVESGKAKGKDYTRDLINSQVVPSYHDKSLEAVKQYRTLMEQYRPQPPAHLLDPKDPYIAPPHSFISFEGFLNAKMLVQMLERMGPDPRQSRIKEVAESLNQIDLEIDVPASYGPGQHQGLDKVYCTVVSDGRFVPLTDDEWQRWKK